MHDPNASSSGGLPRHPPIPGTLWEESHCPGGEDSSSTLVGPVAVVSQGPRLPPAPWGETREQPLPRTGGASRQRGCLESGPSEPQSTDRSRCSHPPDARRHRCHRTRRAANVPSAGFQCVAWASPEGSRRSRRTWCPWSARTGVNAVPTNPVEPVSITCMVGLVACSV